MKKRSILITVAALLFGAVSAFGQETRVYIVNRTTPISVQRTALINWRPETKELQRYVVAVNPLTLINNGLRVDFEYELRNPGQWIQTGLVGYLAPHLPRRYGYNNRFSFNSAFDDYHKMWGIGVAALYKKMLHPRGWYFSTGLMLEFFRVTNMNYGYIPFVEDGLEFFRYDRFAVPQSYVKPTAQFNVGKHMALSQRCFLDIFIGLSYSYSIYRERSYSVGDDDFYYDYQLFTGMNGFARRGLNVNGGLRFGVLLWKNE